MNIYLSWSGELGRRASGALQDALLQLIPTIEVWSPGSDISAGTRWIDQTKHAIQKSELALVCITNDSRSSPWLLYELGVMAGSAAVVIPWLVDIEYSDLEGPLAQFQAIRSDSQSFRQLVDIICRNQSMQPLSQNRIERWASDIETEIGQLVGRGQKTREARVRKEWLALIDEAASARNRDQLQNLRGEAETEGVSDRPVLLALLNAYFDLRDFEGLIDTFERFRKIVGQDPEALSRYAWALVRTSQSSLAIVVLEESRKSGITGAEITALLARAYKDQWREHTAQANPTAAEESLHHAAETYTEGFNNHPLDYYLGLNAVQLLHILGDEGSVSLRDELLPLVQASAERASEESGADYWTTASLLDLAVVRGSQAEAQQLAYQLWSKANSPWEIDTTVQNLRLLSEAKGFGGETPEWLRDLITRLALAGS